MEDFSEVREMVETISRETAEITLNLGQFCTCPSQILFLARKIEILCAGCFCHLAREDNPATAWVVAGITDQGMHYALELYADRLHRPGASAALPSAELRANGGIHEHC